MEPVREEEARRGHDRRACGRRAIGASVRLIVLGPDYVPIAERYCAGVDVSPIGLAVSTPGVLEPGTLIVVSGSTGGVIDVWLACVAHCRLRSDGSRVVGLERREMPAALASAAWLDVLRSAA